MGKKWPQAQAELEQALALNPDFPRARINLALVLAQQDRFDESLKQFQMVLPPEDAHYNLGLMYQSKRKQVEAAQEYKRALQMNPKLTAAQEQLKRMPAAIPGEADRKLQAAELAKAKLAAERQAAELAKRQAEAERQAVETATSMVEAAQKSAERAIREVEAERAAAAAAQPPKPITKRLPRAAWEDVATPAPRFTDMMDLMFECEAALSEHTSLAFKADARVEAPSTQPAVHAAPSPERLPNDWKMPEFIGVSQAEGSTRSEWRLPPELAAQFAADYSRSNPKGAYSFDRANSPLPRTARHASKTVVKDGPNSSRQPE
jgi:tetratricopeptide (TPR) repeat protein